MKIYILTFGLLIFTMVSKSQKINSVSVNYGISHSDLKWDYDANNSIINLGALGSKSINGFYCNANFESFESKYFALVTGVGFYQKGALDEFTSDGVMYSRSVKWNLDYLTIDTKLKAKIRYKNLSPILMVGPRIDYLLRFSSEFDEFDQKAKLNRINYGLRYGIGIQYFINNLILGIGWENNLNFNSVVVNNGENIRPEFTIDDKTMIFKCEIGLMFNR